MKKTTKTAALTVAIATGALVTLFSQSAFNDPAEEKTLCVDNLLIPSNSEEAALLENNARAVYNAVAASQDPLDSQLVASMVREYVEQGKSVTFTGIDPEGMTSTLPDGTSRPVACYNFTVK